mmetsp:Transcript_553/g.1304  ORF Transcript_553/g.1304 Transcript_553/m.1304 type:complete len:218 (-) Transcript_553:845-1498(-)
MRGQWRTTRASLSSSPPDCISSHCFTTPSCPPVMSTADGPPPVTVPSPGQCRAVTPCGPAVYSGRPSSCASQEWSGSGGAADRSGSRSEGRSYASTTPPSVPISRYPGTPGADHVVAHAAPRGRRTWAAGAISAPGAASRPAAASHASTVPSVATARSSSPSPSGAVRRSATVGAAAPTSPTTKRAPAETDADPAPPVFRGGGVTSTRTIPALADPA